MMLLKNWPYWVKGLIIGLLPVISLFFGMIIGNASILSMNQSFLIPIISILFKPFNFLIYSKFSNPGSAMIFIELFYVPIGIVVGFIYGKIRHKMPFWLKSAFVLTLLCPLFILIPTINNSILIFSMAILYPSIVRIFSLFTQDPSFYINYMPIFIFVLTYFLLGAIIGLLYPIIKNTSRVLFSTFKE